MPGSTICRHTPVLILLLPCLLEGAALVLILMPQYAMAAHARVPDVSTCLSFESIGVGLCPLDTYTYVGAFLVRQAASTTAIASSKKATR
jgi:hypothetical protein